MAIDKIVAEYRLELDGLRQDVNNLKGQLKSVDDSVNTSANNTNKKLDDIGNQINGKLTDSFKKLGNTIVAAFTVEKIGKFALEAVNLAAKAEGIKRAFDKLNQPNLLDELRTATKGTVSDLQLMTTAVKASNFKLPLDQLARLLKFAQQRAIETGESIDYLVESIVLGISRKSIPILDNLGLSASEVQNEFQKTGDMAVAVGNIIDKSMTDAGDATLTMAERQAQLRVEFERMKEKIGEALIPTFENLIDIVQQAMTNYGRLLDKMTGGSKLFNEEYDKTIEHANEHNMTLDQINKKIALYYQKSISTFGDEQKINSARLQAYYSLRIELEKSGKTQLDNNQAVQSGNAQTQAQIGLLEQLQQEIENLTELQKKSNDPAEIKNYTIEIDKLQNRIKDLTTVTKSNAKTFGDLDKQTTDLVNTTDNANQSLVSLYLGLADAQQAMASGDVVAYNKALEGMANIMVALADEDIPALKSALGELKDTNKKTTEDAKENWTEYAQEVMGIIASLSNFMQRVDDNRLENLQQRLEQGLISQQQYDAAEKKIFEDKARRDKLLAIFDITLATARGIAQAIPNPLLIAFAAAQGAIQLGTAAALGIPAFKEGVIDFKGKGTGTSDSNLALISRGESIITAKATRKHKDVLEAIQKDKFDEYVMKIYANQIKEKQKDGVNHELQELLYRQLLISNKQIKEDKENTKEIVSAIEKRPHRF